MLDQSHSDDGGKCKLTLPYKCKYGGRKYQDLVESEADMTRSNCMVTVYKIATDKPAK